MSITTNSIDRSVRLAEIGFPEFTAKMIGDVFNSIVSANMSQTEAYIELTRQLSKTVDEFISEGQQNIAGTEILNFLIKVAPSNDLNTGTVIRNDNNGRLSQEEVNKINDAVSIPNTAINTRVANTTSTIKELYPYILENVAKRIAANKYDILQKMVKQGLVRVIINSGEISSILNFQAKDSTFYQKKSGDYDRDIYNFRANSASGDITSEWANYATATKYSTIGISTPNQEELTKQLTTSVQITGAVKLNFSTDYQPLNQLT